MAHTGAATAALLPPQWKAAVSGVAAVLIGLLFIVAGVWKITDPLGAAARLAEAQVPSMFALPGAVLLGIAETYAGTLLLVPRFRRWGAWLTGALLVAFLLYIGIQYNTLRGAECNCFPWVKRAVGPAFFIGDVIMLALAVLAGWWARTTASLRSASLVLGAVTVFALVSYGVAEVRQLRVMAPPSITVEGQPFNLHQGRVFLYFFDPECTHCDAAARQMAKYSWRNVRLIAIPTAQPQFGREFMASTGLNGSLSNDVDLLRKSFSFKNTPYAVALIDGRQKGAFTGFDDREPESGLRKLGFIE